VDRIQRAIDAAENQDEKQAEEQAEREDNIIII
jgi:hypothetical protein